MLKISEASDERRPEIAEFYRDEGPQRELGPSDRVFVAELDGRVVGAVRRCEEEGVLVLRTMRVAAKHQRRGFGRQLLQEFTRDLGERDCFLLGYAHLEKFYSSAGFATIPAADLPPHLQERLPRYLEERSDIVPMRRAARASPAT